MADEFYFAEGSDSNTHEAQGMCLVREADNQYLNMNTLECLMDIRKHDFAMFEAIRDLIETAATSPVITQLNRQILSSN